MKAQSARELLARTAAQVGGIRNLASELELSESVLKRYILGKEAIPEGLMLRIIDVLLNHLPESPKAQ